METLESFENTEGILNDLGLIGWDNYETAIQSFLVIGGSLLLVGSHGEGKTRLFKVLAKALGVTSAKYDASKSMWEDIVGFPDPAKLMDASKRTDTLGLPRIETPSTIWGKRFLLVDEINRASPDMQSKWLEVLLDQTLMGEDVGAKWLVSAMNPGYAGTNPLDLALVSRYMYFIQAPNGILMSPKKLQETLNLENPEEFPALRTWEAPRVEVKDGNVSLVVSDELPEYSNTTVDTFNSAADKLKVILSLSAMEYQNCRASWEDSCNEYLIAVTKSLLTDSKFQTDLRRVRMMKNCLLSMLSVTAVKSYRESNKLPDYIIQDTAKQMLLLSYPAVAGADSPSRQQIETAHSKCLGLLENRNSPIYAISYEEDPIKKLKLLFAYEDRDSILTADVISSIVSKTGVKNLTINLVLFHLFHEGLNIDTASLNILINHLNLSSSQSAKPYNLKEAFANCKRDEIPYEKALAHTIHEAHNIGLDKAEELFSSVYKELKEALIEKESQ